MDFAVVVLLILAIGMFLAVVKYIVSEQNRTGISYGELLISILIGKGYKKASMPNEYPVYKGELEERDTLEYIDFISPDILNLIK